MLDLAQWLVSSDNFMPHGHCFLWQPATLWLNVGSDALIAAAYLAIPVVLYAYARKRKSEPGFAWIPLTFAAFILLCGATHIMEIWTVWNPAYRVAGALKLATGIVSFATLCSLLWIMPRALLLKTPAQLSMEVESRTRELRQANDELRAHIEARDRAERQLRVAQEERARADDLLRTIVESAPTLIYAKDLQGRMILANPAALQFFGKTWPEVQGRTDMEFLEDLAQAEAVTKNDRHLMETDHEEVFEETVGQAGSEERVWMSTKAPIRDATGRTTGLVGVSIDITDRKRLEHRLRLMVDELNHRVKNTLAMVLAIATQTLKNAAPALYGSFQDRLLALSAAHDVLTREKWSGAELRDVAASQLRAYLEDRSRRLDMAGPTIRLSARASLSIAMGLHELATNAVKHGALSNESGRIELHWELISDAQSTLRIVWRELDGPPIKPPSHRGFGSRLIERMLLRDLGGTVNLNFHDPAGLKCVMCLPLRRNTASPDSEAYPLVGSALEAPK